MIHHESRPHINHSNDLHDRHHPRSPSNTESAMTDAEWSAFYETMMSTEDMLPLEDAQ